MKSFLLLIIMASVVLASVYWLVEENPFRIILGDEELKSGLTVAAIFTRIKDSYNFALTKLFVKIAKIKGGEENEDESENYFQKAENAAAEINEPFKKIKAFVLIAKERNESEKTKSSEANSEKILSDLKEAAKSFGETRGSGQNAAASVLGQAVIQTLPLSDSDKNQKIVSQIISEINLALDSEPDKSAAAEALFYSELAFAYFKQGNFEAGRDAINQVSDQNSRLVLFLTLSEKAAGLEDWGRGRNLIETIDIPVYRNYGNFKLMNFLFSKNKLDEAEEIGKSLVGTNFEEAAVLEIAEAYLKTGEKEKALNLIQRVIK